MTRVTASPRSRLPESLRGASPASATSFGLPRQDRVAQRRRNGAHALPRVRYATPLRRRGSPASSQAAALQHRHRRDRCAPSPADAALAAFRRRAVSCRDGRQLCGAGDDHRRCGDPGSPLHDVGHRHRGNAALRCRSAGRARADRRTVRGGQRLRHHRQCDGGNRRAAADDGAVHLRSVRLSRPLLRATTSGVWPAGHSTRRGSRARRRGPFCRRQ